MMNLSDRFRAIDDWLFDRAYQPVVDFVAPLDIKTRHLSAGCFLGGGGIFYYFTHPNSLSAISIILMAMSALLAYAALYVFPSGPIIRLIRQDKRIFYVIIMLLLSVTSCALNFTIFAALYVSASYFLACDDKPPKRHWWKELKKILDVLAWTPELWAWLK